jgi:pimeloyl-ACP methyl ester carboxylesterase
MIYDPTEAAIRARRLLPDADVEVESGVGHLLGMQRPEIVNPRIATFLRDRVTAPVLQPA